MIFNFLSENIFIILYKTNLIGKVPSQKFLKSILKKILPSTILSE